MLRIFIINPDFIVINHAILINLIIIVTVTIIMIWFRKFDLYFINCYFLSYFNYLD